MNPDLQRDLLAALERPHRLGTIGGDLEEQLAHCASFSSVLSQVLGDHIPERGCDLGTGGGLPGVALASMWPTMQWTLVDMRTARADEVERTILRLGLHDRVDVHGIEAQFLGHDEHHREQYDIVVARAFGPPSVTAECAAGLVRPNGVFVVSEPPESGGPGEQLTEPRWDVAGLAELGFGPAELVEENESRFAVMRKQGATPGHIPRLPPRANRGWPASQGNT